MYLFPTFQELIEEFYFNLLQAQILVLGVLELMRGV